MEKLFIIANWKSHKTSNEAKSWAQGLLGFQFPESHEKETIICPPFTSLPILKTFIDENNLPIKMGAQNVSQFEEGAYTGEISAREVGEFAEYVIIGHSERRKNFSETDEILAEKVQKALSQNLIPIFCVQGADTLIPEGVKLVAYEPIFAIGTGLPDTPEDAEMVSKKIKEKYSFVQFVLYGGSVTPEDVNTFTQMQSVDGVLVGGASLDPEKFRQIIENS